MATAFEIIVGQPQRKTESVATASAMNTVSQVAQTYGVSLDVFDVNVYGGGNEDYGIGVCVATEDADPLVSKFTKTIELTDSVESLEEVSYEKLD